MTFSQIVQRFHFCLSVNAPIVISQPHFYEASQEYQNAVEGLNPDGPNHGTVLDVEPVMIEM